MTKFEISEAPHVNSITKATTVECKTLSDAKRIASRMQSGIGIVVKIEWNGELLAFKRDGEWFETMTAVEFGFISEEELNYSQYL